jgi:hypothetical protein
LERSDFQKHWKEAENGSNTKIRKANDIQVTTSSSKVVQAVKAFFTFFQSQFWKMG